MVAAAARSIRAAELEQHSATRIERVLNLIAGGDAVARLAKRLSLSAARR